MTESLSPTAAVKEPDLTDTIPDLKPGSALIGGLLGMVLGLGVLLYDAQATSASAQFVKTPQFLIWSFLIALQPAFWAIVTIPLWQSLGSLRHFGLHPGRSVAEALVIITIGVTFLYLFPAVVGVTVITPSPLAHHYIKMMIITSAAFVSGLPAIGGIRLIHHALQANLLGNSASKQQVQLFLWLYSRLRWYLFILGAMISLGTLTTGALRNALAAFQDAPLLTFPIEFVLLYGGYFAIFIALIYTPTYNRLVSAGNNLRDTFFPLATPSQADWKDWYENRKRFEEFLQLRSGPFEGLRTGITILGPLISSGIAILLGK